MITDRTAEGDRGAAAGERAQLAAALETALEEGALSLRYQPLVRTGDLEVLGFEALLRWRDTERGEISPRVFIPIAEETGIMPRIGRWVVRSATQQLAEWQRQGVASGLGLHINLSASELVDPELPAYIAAEVARVALQPSQIRVEVTESDLDTAGGAADAAVEELAALGFQPALDDFGIESSVGVLTRHPFVYAKLDRDLLVGPSPPPHWHRLLRGIGGLARALGIILIAERIEGKQDMARIAALGFAQAQGYALGRPETVSGFTGTLAGQRRSWDDSVD